MTPGARIAAAIGILDAVLAGTPAEQALTNWARASRFAGSGDRAAVRDHVFDALRCRRSFGALGGGGDTANGRALMIGALRSAGIEPDMLFTGAGHAPAPLTDAERAVSVAPGTLPAPVACDCPDWLWPRIEASLGAVAAEALTRMQARAPVFLRVNLARTDVAGAKAALEAAGIATGPAPLAPAALRVTAGSAKLRAAAPYLEGLVELQDVAPQAAVAMLPLRPGMRVLDYCAGGGGKALAMAAAEPALKIWAHDADPARMRDLPARAARAGARIATLATGELAATTFDLVVTDVPCSGTGTWARTPDAKWRLTPARLDGLVRIQRGIVAAAARLVRPGGALAYMTCSVLREENEDRIADFLAAATGWKQGDQRRFSPTEGGDGFFVSILTRENSQG